RNALDMSGMGSGIVFRGNPRILRQSARHVERISLLQQAFRARSHVKCRVKMSVPVPPPEYAYTHVRGRPACRLRHDSRAAIRARRTEVVPLALHVSGFPEPAHRGMAGEGSPEAV